MSIVPMPVFHPGPPEPTPEERLLLMNDTDWEAFIEECARQLMAEGNYSQVHRLGGAGDKGRDVCGYTKSLPEIDSWDLYQAKHYAGTLSPSEFAPELAKFLFSVFSGAYTRPRSYFLCPLRLGVKLLDHILNPEQMRLWILEEWKKKDGQWGSYTKSLSSELEEFIEAFPFDIIKAKSPADLLEVHQRTASHWSRFGVLGRRDPNPVVPDTPVADEQIYVSALLRVYSEHSGSPISVPSGIPHNLHRHFSVQRRLFYSAEGLNRFSRDKLPGAFDDLLEQIELGVGSVVLAPHANGMTRLQQTLAVANTLQVTTNPLSARFKAGDLQGGCHHLVNQERMNWVYDSDE
jgi:hypothetical protein